MNGLYRTIFNRWDPILFYDGHLMGRVQHGYAIGYATCTVPAAHPGPRGYVFDKLFPAVREATRKDFGLEVFTHGDIGNTWPPTAWSHEAAMWTTEAKFVANAYGLRNRMAILAETPGHESFERRIYAHYALIAEILEYCRQPRQGNAGDLPSRGQGRRRSRQGKAESGELKNWWRASTNPGARSTSSPIRSGTCPSSFRARASGPRSRPTCSSRRPRPRRREHDQAGRHGRKRPCPAVI